jgi:transposase
MRFVGLDVHKRETEACVIDEAGEILHRERLPTTREGLERFARRHLGPDARVALEATTNTWGVVAVLAPLCASVTPSNPMRTRAIAEAKVKTDKVDALVLAQLLRTDFLPGVWVPDDRTRVLRELTSRRAVLVSDSTRLKNRIHAVLHQRMIPLGADRLFSAAGLRLLSSLPLDPRARASVDGDLALLEAVGRELDATTLEIARMVRDDASVRLLMTLPGVSLIVAQAILAALGDPGRFESGDKAASYLGLVPSTRQSGDHCRHGRITKQGNGHARWLLVQAAQHLDRHPGPLGAFFRKIAKRKNRNVAVVATARKLVVIAWHMLTSGEPYRYAEPRRTKDKLAQLRVLAGGERRRGGNAKGSPRSAT